MHRHFLMNLVKEETVAWVQWFMTVIPAHWEAKVGGSRGQEFRTSLASMYYSSHEPPVAPEHLTYDLSQ
ncbi:hypothetical protein AAY473_036079 [Plecturocebus cupreus]